MFSVYIGIKVNNRDFPGPVVAQWLRLCSSNEGSVVSIPGWDTKIPHASWHGQKVKTIKKTIRIIKSITK